MVPPLLRSLLRTTPTLAPISHRRILSVSGSQASEFLNGLLSTPCNPQPYIPFYSAFLHAQGKVLYDVFLFTTTESNGKSTYLLDYDGRPSEAPPLLSYLKRHVLRSKVKIRDVSEEYDSWAAWGSSFDHSWESPRRWTWTESAVMEPVWDMNAKYPWGMEDLAIQDRRAVGLGRRLLARKGDRPNDTSTHDIVSAEAYTLHRILHGVPEGSEEIVPMHAFPMESNLDVMGGLDFRKGCYVGQELTVRTYHRGMVRKRIFPVALQSPDPRQHNAMSLTSSGDIRPVVIKNEDSSSPTPRPRGTGKLLVSQNGVGLALLRLEHVAGFERGVLELELANDEFSTRQSIVPWWPEWWPQQPSNVVDEHQDSA